MKLIGMYAEEVKQRVKAEWERDLAVRKEQASKDIQAWYDRNRQPDGSVIIKWMA